MLLTSLLKALELVVVIVENRFSQDLPHAGLYAYMDMVWMFL
jgi:hypothetical protein